MDTMPLDGPSTLTADVFLAGAEAIAAFVAVAGSFVVESDALRTVGTDATLGVWLGVFGLVLLVAGVQFARDAANRSGLV